MKVDLPEPEGPTRNTNSPLSIESVTSSSPIASVVYALVTLSRMTIGPSPGRSTERRSLERSDSPRRRARSRTRDEGVSGRVGVEGASVLMKASNARLSGGEMKGEPPSGESFGGCDRPVKPGEGSPRAMREVNPRKTPENRTSDRRRDVRRAARSVLPARGPERRCRDAGIRHGSGAPARRG